MSILELDAVPHNCIPYVLTSKGKVVPVLN
jgi:hypothetical protein